MPNNEEATSKIATGPNPGQTVWEKVGGEAFFDDLVTAFYNNVSEDPILRPMYPEEDLGPAAERLKMFLVQYWGGPREYSEKRGHPRLRMRHGSFTLDTAGIDAWVTAMDHAIDTVSPSPDVADELREYFVRAANFLRNDPN